MSLLRSERKRREKRTIFLVNGGVLENALCHFGERDGGEDVGEDGGEDGGEGIGEGIGDAAVSANRLSQLLPMRQSAGSLSRGRAKLSPSVIWWIAGRTARQPQF